MTVKANSYFEFALTEVVEGLRKDGAGVVVAVTFSSYRKLRG